MTLIHFPFFLLSSVSLSRSLSLLCCTLLRCSALLYLATVHCSSVLLEPLCLLYSLLLLFLFLSSAQNSVLGLCSVLFSLHLLLSFSLISSVLPVSSSLSEHSPLIHTVNIVILRSAFQFSSDGVYAFYFFFKSS